MFIAGIAFLVGVILFQRLVDLPHFLWGFLLPLCLFVACYRSVRISKWVRYFSIISLGFLWALISAHLRMANTMPAELEGVDLNVSGYIASMPVQRGRVQRFEFDITQIEYSDKQSLPGLPGLPVPSRVRLNWYGQRLPLSPGEHWALTVRLKAPHGFMNPGGFDYEAWLFSKGIMATGYVRKDDGNRLLDSHWYRYSLGRLRQALVAHLSGYLVDADYKGVILALVVGERQHISQEQWTLFRKTGTSHLVAISGLHIGLIAALVFFFSRYLWNGVVQLNANFGLRVPRQCFSAVLALLAACVYAALAGFALPTLRALVMLSVVLGAVLLRRPVLNGSSLGIALILVLLLDPFSVHAAGFWLSFSAVSVLFYLIYFGRKQQSYLRKSIQTQLVLALALVPICLFWFQYAAVSASIANLIAIPLVSFVIVPLCLLAAFVSTLSGWLGSVLLQLVDQLLSLMSVFLQALAAWPMGQWAQHAPEPWALLMAGLGVLMLISPKGMPARYIGAVLVLPIFFSYPNTPSRGEAWLSLLDVGQGLSLVVETKQHTLVYDTGPRLSDRFDTGASVVVPFMRSRGIRRLDTLLVSHADLDHSGGVNSVIAAYPPDVLLVGEPLKLDTPIEQRFCQHGQSWQWDGVEFEILYPRQKGEQQGNNASCVLRVSAGDHRVLIMGDIEKKAEWALLSTVHDLEADIVVAPHHGSRTSSTQRLVSAVSPQFALFASGYRNRYGFPKVDIVRRYQQQGSKVLTSFEYGAITFRMGGTALLGPESYRDNMQKYWHHRF